MFMGHTQPEIDNILNLIINEYTGKSIAYFGSYPNECSVPVAYYVDKVRGTSPVPAMANDRADGWGVNFPSVLNSWFTHEPFQMGKAYPRGTILMWNSPHIAIVQHSDGSNNVQVFEQNADPDGSVCGTKNRVVNTASRQCTYALMPVIDAPAPAPPTPPTPVPPANYSVVTNVPGYVTSNEAANHSGSTVSVPIGNYYVFNQANGMVNVTNKVGTPGAWINPGDNKIAPLPPPIVTATVTAKPAYTPPTGAMLVPTPNTRYQIEKTILGFLAYSNAAAHKNASTTVNPGSYFIFKETGGMINVTKTQGVSGYWINPADNTPYEPETSTPSPNSWKASYSSFSDDRTPIKYVFLEDYMISDLSGQRPDVFGKKYSEINIYGTFIKDKIMYYRPKQQTDTLFRYYFGIPERDPMTGIQIIEQYNEIYNEATNTASRIATKTITPKDRLVILGEYVGKWWDIITNKKS